MKTIQEMAVEAGFEDYVYEATNLFEAFAALVREDAQRKPLSNEQIGQAARDAHIAFCLNKHQTYEHALTRAIEAAHGIKE